MDSLTQIVLGAGIGELCLGKKIGNKALLIGAIAGTIPDLDVFITSFVKGDLAYLKIHRSYSHAAFTQFILAFPLAWITFKLFKGKTTFKENYWIWFWGLITHPMLDCCTTYGTQFFLPFSHYLVGFNNINIIDPLYTLPFMGILIALMFKPRESLQRAQLRKWAFVVSCGYMALTFVSKYIAHTHFESELKRHNISYQHLSTTPAILNNVLWAGIAYDDSMLYVSDYSHFQQDKTIDYAAYPKNTSLLNQVEDKDITKTLLWFSQDKYFVTQDSKDTLNFFNVKWGRMDGRKTAPKEAFVFYYQIYRDVNQKWQMRTIQPDNKTFSFKEAFRLLWQRIWHK